LNKLMNLDALNEIENQFAEARAPAE
jgi:hypothetical protein